MKKARQHIYVLFLLMPIWSAGQLNIYWKEPTIAQADSLKQVLAKTTNDTASMYLNRQLGMHYQEKTRTVSMSYYQAMLGLARKVKQQVWEAEAMSRIGYMYTATYEYAEGLRALSQAQALAEQSGIERGIWKPELLQSGGDPHLARLTVFAGAVQHLGILHSFAGDYPRSIAYHQQVRKLNETLQDQALASLSYLNTGEAYNGLNKPDSAKRSFLHSVEYAEKSGHRVYTGLAYYFIGKICEKEGNSEEAKKYYRKSYIANIEMESPDFEGMAYQALADMALNSRQIDSSFFYSRKALSIYNVINDTLGLIGANNSLSAAYGSSGQTDSAYYFLKKTLDFKNGLNKEERVKVFQSIGLNEQIKVQELEAAQLRTQTKIRTYSFIGGIIVLLLFSAFFYRNYQRQRKDKAIIEKSYADLKATQSQLIQSEKMASLGELTAGIAHEIQNPLNFVNNFSELSAELIDEMNEELNKGDIGEAKSISADIKQNLEKINHHGKRADAIVKGMLQHSRTSSGQKEPTDINELTDEYLRLSYHGIRAKDKNFNATMETNFEPATGKASIIPQDIGRVLLNLFNNAFYAVKEKMEQSHPGYRPTISVNTSRINDKITISVKDNGNGIPRNIIDKVFQPFFTTKPTGQGTGLGLSLTYDIVKAHGGDIKIETKEQEGTIFHIELPF
ncbi:ATP-binding protein [Terrimonas sp. NA20]|uniref:histidine kinase n=1 Tax=Terrimonas ginsenosidimutans TaxID=2908004 RepID=A0ABS9KLT7_9BACT|nr:ATP-binding protein [Terrimonas ginsenosidimutans]MCG2613285.1 ATP-binding protein [Terrimonas ginsenosidimutans]